MTQFNSTTEKKTRKPRTNVKAYARKNTSMTFWNELRIRNNYNLKDLSDVLGVSLGRLSRVLTGKEMPSRTFSDKICQLFGVAPNDGWTQFENGFNVYHNTHGKTVTVKPVKVNPVIEDKINSYCANGTDNVKQPKETVNDDKTEILKVRPADRSLDDLLVALASSMKIEDFIELIHQIDERSVSWDNVFDQVYGKIDITTFIKLVRLKNG